MKDIKNNILNFYDQTVFSEMFDLQYISQGRLRNYFSLKFLDNEQWAVKIHRLEDMKFSYHSAGLNLRNMKMKFKSKFGMNFFNVFFFNTNRSSAKMFTI